MQGWIDKRFAINTSRMYRQNAIACHGSGGEGAHDRAYSIEFGDVIILLGEGRAILPAHTEVKRQIGSNLPVVLRISAIQRLAEMHHEVVGQDRKSVV